jgi:uncharacterized protein GlcG (DUF336 family)
MAKLRAAECREFIQAVVEKAGAMGVPVSIAVVGPEGHLIAVERMDDAGFITPETAIAKAFTVAAFRSMSPRFPDGLVIQQWFKERNPQLLVSLAAMTNGRIAASGGSAPVFRGDEMVGAYWNFGRHVTARRGDGNLRTRQDGLGSPSAERHDRRGGEGAYQCALRQGRDYRPQALKIIRSIA